MNGRLRHLRRPLRADRMTVTRRSASGGASPSGRYQFGEVAEPVLGREVRPSLLGLPGIAGRGRRRQFFEEGLKPGRGYHLNCSRQLVGGIPERVSDSTRFEQIASLGRFELPSATRTPIVPAATYVYSSWSAWTCCGARRCGSSVISVMLSRPAACPARSLNWTARPPGGTCAPSPLAGASEEPCGRLEDLIWPSACLLPRCLSPSSVQSADGNLWSSGRQDAFAGILPGRTARAARSVMGRRQR